jgi:DNA-binding NtrC family response regulator
MTRPIRVMVIDDEAIVCERLAEFLTAKGLEVETFTESAEGLARLEQAEFDVLLTDLRMSGPDGLDVLRFVRDRGLPTQGILISAYCRLENVRDADALEAFDVVAKPFRLAEVHKLVLRAARNTRKPRAARE